MKRDRSSSPPQTAAGTQPAPPKDWHETVVGGKYVRLLEKHVHKLRDEAPHGNRQLFLDDVFLLSLLAFHNPTLRSLRTREDFTTARGGTHSFRNPVPVRQNTSWWTGRKKSDAAGPETSVCP